MKMQYKFNANGHKNILADHKTTLEFTKDAEVSLRGDCIIGVNADFDLENIKRFIKKLRNNKIMITIRKIPQNKKYKEIQEMIKAELNLNFNSNKELVIRKTDFVSERTFAVRADKAAFELNRQLITYLKKIKNKVSVIIEPLH